MLEYRDILYIVLALCALWFTVFLCFVLYQAAMLIKRVHALVDDLKVRLGDVEQSLLFMRKKFDGNIAMVTGIADGVRRIIETLRDRR